MESERLDYTFAPMFDVVPKFLTYMFRVLAFASRRFHRRLPRLRSPGSYALFDFYDLRFLLLLLLLVLVLVLVTYNLTTVLCLSACGLVCAGRMSLISSVG